MLAYVLYIIFQQLNQIFKKRFICTFLNGNVLFCCILLDTVEKSTVAENFGKNGKSNRRKDFIRASAGKIRKTAMGLHVFSLYRTLN